MKILAIETSCDETAIALIDAKGGLKKPSFKILKNLVSSQIEIHRPFGGVVPNLAKREHLKNLPLLFDKIVKDQRSKIKDVSLIAVTAGPGLEPALWTGINFATDLYKKLRIKNKELRIIGASHLEGHLYSFFLNSKFNPPAGGLNSKSLFPAIALIISGGHTILIKMDSSVKYKKIGETCDDAVGEAFDKVARLLELPYPGGPEIEKLAKLGNPDAVNFPRPMINQKNYDFSFSGLKTSVLYYLRDNKDFKKEDVAASFQKAAFDVLIKKTLRAAEEFNVKSIFISGGVAANKTLQKKFRTIIKNKMPNIKFFAPSKKFCTDNATMIAAVGYINYLQGKKRKLVANGNLSL